MRILKLNHSESLSSLKSKMNNSKTVAIYKRWHILYMISRYHVDAEYLSDTTGYSKATIYSIVAKYNKNKDVCLKPKGGRKREYMSINEEKEFMKTLEAKALKGLILTSSDIKKAVENKLGRDVSDDYIWDLFKRNGWTKHTPRPSHPKKDENLQEEFKKNSKAIWLPLKMILTHR